MNYIEINKNLWNKKTEIHVNSDFYDVDAFMKGKSSLNSIELDLLGDIKGKKVLHLQCHFGLDTLSLARLGADVTGVDLSDVAISKAKYLADKSGLKARFIQSDIYDLSQVLNEEFDIVFTSYGVIGWLPDTNKWAEVICNFLSPSGTFVMVEFHPVIWMFSDDFTKVEYDYLKSDPIVEHQEGTYADENAAIKEESVSWNHGLSEVIQPLLNQGLKLEALQEINYSPYDCFKNTVEVEDGKYQIKGLEGKLPMLYAIVAKK